LDSNIKAELSKGSFTFQIEKKNKKDTYWEDFDVKCAYLTRQEGVPK